jgi:hypothetical protein
MAAPSKPRIDLRWELLPLFLIILSFALGFIIYGEAIRSLDKAGQEHYGFDWETMSGIGQWMIPAMGLGVYLLLAAGAWALARVKDPVRDWNFAARLLGRPEITDPLRKEAIRRTLIRWVYVLKVVLPLLAVVAQWGYFRMLMHELGYATV